MNLEHGTDQKNGTFYAYVVPGSRHAAGHVLIGFVLLLVLSSFCPEPESPWMLPERGVKAAGESRPAPQPYTLPLRYADAIIFYCDEQGVPVWLICKLIKVESDWNPRAVSWANALGLTQILARNTKIFADLYNDGKPVDLFDPETSIRCGIRLLGDLYRETGSWRIALMCYHAGSGYFHYPRRFGDWPWQAPVYASVILGEAK